MIQKAGIYFVPLILTVVALILMFAKKDLFPEFVKGAKNGLETCINLIPMFVILITAVGMFSNSGAMTAICGRISRLLGGTDFPSEVLPVIIMRPISGSAATATVNELFTQSGPDSFAGRCASVIMGASDTVIYTLALYFGSVGVTKTRHAYPAAFLTLGFCVVFSYYLTLLFYGK